MTAAAIGHFFIAHWLELAGFATTWLGIWLTARRNMWCWPITLALPPATLAAIFAAPPAPSAARKRRAADPLARPFAEVPLGLSAVLVDMRLSMKVLAALRPGALLPIAVARQVPLRLADLSGDGPTLATGTVGAAEDRVALQITTAF